MISNKMKFIFYLFLFTAFFGAGYFYSNSRKSGAMSTDINKFDRYPYLNLPISYFSEVDTRWGSVESQEASFGGEDAYQSYPTTDVTLNDYSNERKKLKPPIYPYDLDEKNVDVPVEKMRRYYDLFGKVVGSYLPEEIVMNKEEFDVDGDGVNEIIVEITGIEAAAGQTMYAQIIKNSEVIFTTDARYPKITSTKSGNGFYIEWHKNEHFDRGECCPTGHIKTRFVYENGKFTPVYEQEVAYVKVYSPGLRVSDGEIRFDGKLLETSETLPYIFLEDYLKLDDNAKYTYSILGSHNSENQFLRVDKLVYDAASFSSRVTAFYLYNPNSGEYKRVLQSTEEQNQARYPETEIISQDPLTVRFYYDVSRPLQCYGDGCRSFWADHYRWDSGQEKFVEINGEFIGFYKDLLKKYEAMDASGCDFDNTEGKQLGTLEDVYNSSQANYCIDTSGSKPNKRADLNKFFEYKNKLSNIVNANQLSERDILAKYYSLQTGNYWEYEGTKREQVNAKDIETSQIKIKVKVVGVQTTEGRTIVDLDGQSDYLIKGNSIYSRESWGDELILQFPLYVGQKWGDGDSPRYRDNDFYAWHVEEKFPRSILGKNYDDCFKITNKVISAPTAYKIFCYGIGYVEDFYEHKGTVEEWKYELVNTNID